MSGKQTKCECGKTVRTPKDKCCKDALANMLYHADGQKVRDRLEERQRALNYIHDADFDSKGWLAEDVRKLLILHGKAGSKVLKAEASAQQARADQALQAAQDAGKLKLLIGIIEALILTNGIERESIVQVLRTHGVEGYAEPEHSYDNLDIMGMHR